MMSLQHRSQAVQQPVAVARRAQLTSCRFPATRIYAGCEHKNVLPLACELQAMVCELSGFQSDACKALLHEAEVLETVKALAQGDAEKVKAYSGDPLGITALAQLLEPHVPPEQQQLLSAASAAAAALPPQLSAQQEALQLLQEPLVRTAFNRMRSDPVLGLSTYGSNPTVSKTMGLLDQVLAEDQHTSQVVEFMLAAASAQQHTDHHRQQQQQGAMCRQEVLQQQQQQDHMQPSWHLLEPQMRQQPPPQQSPQRRRQATRTAVIALSASNHPVRRSSNVEAAASRSPASNP